MARNVKYANLTVAQLLSRLKRVQEEQRELVAELKDVLREREQYLKDGIRLGLVIDRKKIKPSAKTREPSKPAR